MWKIGATASAGEDFCTVIFHASIVGLGQFLRQVNAFAFVDCEVSSESTMWQVTLEFPAQDNAEFFVQRYQSCIEGGIVERREAQSVPWIQSLAGKIPPRFDVTCNQKARHCDSRNATANTIGVEDSLPEKLLSASYSNRCPSFGRSGRRSKTYRPLQLHLFSIKEIQFFVVISREKVVQQLLACRTELIDTSLELVPQLFVLPSCTFKAFDASLPLYRVERCEVAELHSQTVRRSPQLLCHFNNNRIAVMQLSERELAVEVECNQQVLACPGYAGSFRHGSIMPESVWPEKKEIYTSSKKGEFMNPKRHHVDANCFTVICGWHTHEDACETWEQIKIVIKNVGDEQAAADNACLYLIRDRGGIAEALLVIEGSPRLCVPHAGVFDAEEYDENITFGGEIVSCSPCS